MATGGAVKPAKAKPKAAPVSAAASGVAASDDADAEVEPPEAKRAPYTAVIYVHGIGNQRRYEETSRLVDRLDQYLQREHQRGNSIGMLAKIEPRVEPLRPDPDKGIIAYIRTIFATGPKFQGARAVRFYEIYWAPIMAQTGSATRVIRWLFRQPLRPWSTLRAPWRERQRLRRAVLVGMSERGQARPPGVEEQDYRRLMKAYNDFEGPAALRNHPEGSFEAFLDFVAEQAKGRPETARRRQTLARAWRAAYVREELRNAFALATMALALLLLAGAAVAGALQALQAVFGYAPLAELFRRADAPLKADWKTALTVVTSLAGLLGLGKLLTDYLGDVEAWATYEETDVKHEARQRVLDTSLEVLTHVLGDPACERVAIVAHSLGTSVAHDALLALTRRNRAFRPENPMAGPVPLGKIEHFVTMGSPIDKIEYFFESYASEFHRYKRVVEALRGDIGSPPFTDNRKPHVHWINFWDEGDVISGALHSPASGAEFSHHVDNYHIASLRFPDPGASHAGYFDNRTVIRTIFEAIYQRAGSFELLTQPGPNEPYDYDSVYLGSGEPRGGRRVYPLLFAAVPWLALAGLIGWLLGARLFALGAWALAVAAVAVVLIGYLASRARGQLTPL
jgi:hypothetical protein